MIEAEGTGNGIESELMEEFIVPVIVWPVAKTPYTLHRRKVSIGKQYNQYSHGSMCKQSCVLMYGPHNVLQPNCAFQALCQVLAAWLPLILGTIYMQPTYMSSIH